MLETLAHDAAKAHLRASLAAYLCQVWLTVPDSVSVTADLTVDRLGCINAVVTVSDDFDVQRMRETL